MSERELRAFTHSLEGIEQDDRIFEAEMAAWFAAVRIADYIGDTDAGTRLKLTIYGNPYQDNINHPPEVVASMIDLYRQATLEWGLQTVSLERPSVEDILVTNPYLEDPITKQAYFDHFNDMLECWGFRAIQQIGPQAYLDQVPAQLDRIVYQGPNGLKTVLNGEGFVAEGYDLQPNPDRPNGERGVFGGRPRHQEVVDRIARQLAHLSANKEKFVFDTSDDLGYRLPVQTEEALRAAWQGWESTGI